MICPHCHIQLPSHVVAPNFCIQCGRPVAQACPYEEPENATRLELRNDQGQAPPQCPGCHNLLKVCRACGRLHRLEETVCRTKDCLSKLSESTKAFPSTDGALNGTRVVEWAGDFGLRISQIAIQDVEELQYLVYRYGVLVAVSGRNLTAYHWANNSWSRSDTLPLTHARSKVIRSVILDDGYAYVLTDDEAYDVSIGSFTTLQTIKGKFLRQAKGHGIVVRLLVPEGSQYVTLSVNCHYTAEEYSWPLPRIIHEFA